MTSLTVFQRLIPRDWSATRRTEHWAEATWLGAITFVPIVFSVNGTTLNFEDPKRYALHFFALFTAGLLTWTGAKNLLLARRHGRDVPTFDLSDLFRSGPERLVLLSAGLFSFGYLLSTLLSPSIRFSTLGVGGGFTGYNLYTYLSIAALFTSMLVYGRNIFQIWRVMYVLVFVGMITSIYGIFQSNGIDPIGIESESDRVVSTFGNPIYFGAFLVFSIPATAAIIVRPFISQTWVRALVVGIMASTQTLALWLSASRGPMFGVTAAVLVILVMLAVLHRRQISIRDIAVVATPIGLSIVTLIVIAPSGGIYGRSLDLGGELSVVSNRVQSSLTRTETPGQDPLDNLDGFVAGTDVGVDASGDIPPVNGGVSAQELAALERVPISARNGGRLGAGLTGRTEIWGDVGQILTSWKTPADDNQVASILRPVFGLGPDMLRYSTPLVSEPRVSFEVVDHAHNRYLQVFSELGWFGLLTYLSVVATTTALIISVYLRIRAAEPDIDPASTILFAVLTGMFIGNQVEQMVGVGRITDIMLGWLIIASLFVLKRTIATRPATGLDTELARPLRKRSGDRSARSRSVPAIPPFVPGLSAGVIAILALVLFISIDVSNLRASMLAAKGSRDVALVSSFATLQRALDIDRSIESLAVISADRLLQQTRHSFEQGDLEDSAFFANAARSILLKFEELNPLAIDNRVMLANVASIRVQLGLEGSRQEMVARFEDLARQFPNEGVLLSAVASMYVINGQYDDAVATANRAIRIEAETDVIPGAWFARAVGLEKLGETRGSVIAYLSTIARSPRSRLAAASHRGLATAFESAGDSVRAEAHREEAAAIEAAL